MIATLLFAALLAMVGSNPAAAQRAADMAALARPPAANWDDLEWFNRRHELGDGGNLYGVLHHKSSHGDIPAPHVSVFLLPVSDYTGWVMEHAIDYAVAGYPVVIDHRIAEQDLRTGYTADDGSFGLGYVPDGAYYFFTALDVTFGKANPVYDTERGWMETATAPMS